MGVTNTAIIYLSLSIITALMTHLSLKAKDKLTTIFCASIAIFLPSIFAGIRYGIGTDYFVMYRPYFESLINRSIFRDNMEFGYKFLNKFIALLGGDIQIVLFIMALITLFFTYLTLYEYKDRINVFMGMFTYMLLFYLLSFNAVRQMTAVSIVVYSIKYITKRNFLHFFILVILAFSMHYTAIIILPFYFLYKIFGTNKHKLILLLTFGIGFILSINYQQILYPIFKQVDSLSYYAHYFIASKKFEFTFGMLARIMPFILPIIIFYKEIQNDKTFFMVYNLVVVGCIVRLMAYTSNFFVERLSFYFLAFEILLVPYYFKLAKIKNRKWLSYLLFASIVFLWWYDYFDLRIGEVIPYKTIFN